MIRHRDVTLVLDLETVVDPSLPPPKKRDDGSDTFPAIPLHQIVVVGAALLDSSCRLRRIWIVGENEGKGEQGMLTALVGFLNGHLAKGTTIRIMGFNSRGFDLPVIVSRCLRHGLSFPWFYRSDARRRYIDADHLDVMDFLVDHGATRAFSLDLAAKLIGLPGKLDVHGADVVEMIAAGQLEQVRGYCMSDVVQTTALFLRVQLLRGELTPEQYVEAVHALLRGIDQEPRLAPLRLLIDRDRLLLQEAPVETVQLKVA
jgi:hypothetical protein